MLGRVVDFKSKNIVLKATSKVMTVTRLAVSSHTKSGGNFSAINGNLVFEGSAVHYKTFCGSALLAVNVFFFIISFFFW